MYWVLLLLPTIGVGVGAFYLLRREQERLLERSGRIEESRRTALRTRARLAVENVELIVSDLQFGLLETLASSSGGDTDRFLDNLQRANPLVHATFRCDAQGVLLRPSPGGVDEAGGGFVRRFSGPLRAAAPSFGGELNLGRNGLKNDQAPAPALSLNFEQESAKAKDKQDQKLQAALNEELASAQKKETSTKGQERQEAFSAEDRQSDYAANVQRARRDVQSLAKLNSSTDSLMDEGKGSSSRQAAPAPASARKRNAPEPAAEAIASAPALLADRNAPAPQPSADRRGWLPVLVEGRLYLLAWYQSGPAAEVRGLELEMTALVSRLGAALPTDLAEGEGLCLRDERGRLFHQAGSLPNAADSSTHAMEVARALPSLLTRIPLNDSLLPGWTVEAYLRPFQGATADESSAFMLTGSLLAGILLVAILSGGLLLLMQARASAREALVKTSFVANVSHELKTPLTTIRLYADLLEQGRVREDSRRAEYLRTIGRESERLSRLVNNVLDFSRLERGLRPLRPEGVDLVAELRALCATHAPRLAEAGLQLNFESPTALPPARADRDALGQILINLLDNAAKYAAEGGELTLSVSLAGEGRLRVRVADRGPGVPAGERERIFLKFHRLDQSLTAEKGGAGLGLSIARQLARAMGGELSCLPREGGGSIFELLLPEAGVTDTPPSPRSADSDSSTR